MARVSYSKLQILFILLLVSLIGKSVSVPSSSHSREKMTTGSHLLALGKLQKCGFNPENILDIGAGTGEWTKSVSKLFPSAFYLLVEADKTFEPELKSLSASEIKHSYNITAITRAESKIKLFSSEEGSGGSVLKPHSGKVSEAEVATTTLDKLQSYQAIKRVFDLVKIDVGGSELHVLKGGVGTLRAASVVLVETFVMNSRQYTSPFSMVIDAMYSNGLYLYDIIDEERDKNNMLISTDLVFVKRKSPLWEMECTGYPLPSYFVNKRNFSVVAQFMGDAAPAAATKLPGSGDAASGDAGASLPRIRAPPREAHLPGVHVVGADPGMLGGTDAALLQHQPEGAAGNTAAGGRLEGGRGRGGDGRGRGMGRGGRGRGGGTGRLQQGTQTDTTAAAARGSATEAASRSKSKTISLQKPASALLPLSTSSSKGDSVDGTSSVVVDNKKNSGLFSKLWGN
jgi:FkbM family methyltransferase